MITSIPIVRWLFLSITLLGSFLFVTWDYFSKGLAEDNSQVSSLILILFVIGMIQSLRVSILNTYELRQLKKLTESRDPSQIKGSMKSVFENSLKLIDQGDEVDFSSMLKNYQIQYLNIVRSVSVVSGVLITTGLLGTVIGLIITVSGISNVLNAVGQDYEMMIRGMNKTVEGMGSAFYTTFFGGLLGGVVLRLLSTENSRSASRLIASCENLGACWIMPLSRRAARSSSTDLEKEFFQVKQVLSDFSKEVEAIGIALAGSRNLFEDCLEEAVNHTQESFVNVISERTNDLSLAFEKINISIQESQIVLRESLNQSTNEFREKMDIQLNGIQNGLSKIGQLVEQSHAPIIGAMEKTQGDFIDFLSNQLEDLTNGLKGITTIVQSEHEPLRAELQRLTEGVSQAVKITKDTISHASQIEDNQRQKQASELADRLRQASVLLNEFADYKSNNESDKEDGAS